MVLHNALVVFQGKNIRRTRYKDEWWFVLEDIICILTDSKDPKQYIQKMKQRDKLLAQGWVQIVHTLPIDTSGGKQGLNCVSTKGAFRILQSIPSSKAEPFKRWLAKVGYERVQEIENPELAQKRMKQIYKSKGYSNEWIEKRVRGIGIRDELTDEWNQRGIKTKKEYAMLTATISKATFGLTPIQYKEFKKLKQGNLRDHMDDIELVLTMLGEATTTRFTRDRDSKRFLKLRKDSKDGGKVAGSTRRDIEKRLGDSVVSPKNYLETPEKLTRIEKKNKLKSQ
ncbi:phage antirepressor protein [archaeon]|nr:phage antirepressor protein [archaeon]